MTNKQTNRQKQATASTDVAKVAAVEVFGRRLELHLDAAVKDKLEGLVNVVQDLGFDVHLCGLLLLNRGLAFCEGAHEVVESVVLGKVSLHIGDGGEVARLAQS